MDSQIESIVNLLTEIRDRLPVQITQQEADAIRKHVFESFTLTQRDIEAHERAKAELMLFPLPPAKPAGSASIRDGLPDPVATPGAWNIFVTQTNAQQTIGTPGWTATVRPPVSYTDALKKNKMVEYGLTGDPADYELDHLIPLCCGGHPTSEDNLWPQPRTGQFGARTKDLTEVAAQHAVLNGIMHLDEVRNAFSQDWISLHAKLFANTQLRSILYALPHPEDEP